MYLWNIKLNIDINEPGLTIKEEMKLNCISVWFIWLLKFYQNVNYVWIKNP